MRRIMTEVRERTWAGWVQKLCQEYERLHENLEEMLKTEEFTHLLEYQQLAKMSNATKGARKEKGGIEW